MRILLFITGHSQLEEYNYFSKLLNSLSISNICDVLDVDCKNEAINIIKEAFNKHNILP